jgi:hypothetical protein
MADKKKQHYVARFYLKIFSVNNNGATIGIFNLASSMLFSGGKLKNQAYKNYFYGRDLQVGNALEMLEGIAARVIKNIMNKNQMPLAGSREYYEQFLKEARKGRYNANEFSKFIEDIKSTIPA